MILRTNAFVSSYNEKIALQIKDLLFSGDQSSENNSRRTILSSLLSIQDRFGYIPEIAIETIATYMNVSINDVWSVASFYKNFRFEPPAKHLIEVCWGPSCYFKDCSTMISMIFDLLGLVDEGTNRDGDISVRYNTCLGACAQGPVISIDGQLKGKLNGDTAVNLIKKLKESAN